MNTIFLCNAYEAYLPFFKDSCHQLRNLDILSKKKIYSAMERTAYYLKEPKILITNKPLAHECYIKSLGYDFTVLLPKEKSYSICNDFTKDINLQTQIFESLNPDKPIQIIPYSSTPEFYDLFRYCSDNLKFSVEIPESPGISISWLREALVRKSVFVTLSDFLFSGTNCFLPSHIVADGYRQASFAVSAFLSLHISCLVKPNAGCLGLGLTRFYPENKWTNDEIEIALRNEVSLGDSCIVVEAWIPSGTECQSPSVEAFVPREGEPYVTYICDQVFSESKLFSGIALRPEFYETAWAKTLSDGAMAVARRLQSLGYCGYFDLDAIVDPDGQVYVVEMNPRRTGGTHVHEMAEFLVGKDYRDKVALLSGSLTLKQPCTWPELEAVLREASLLYPLGTVIPVQTSSLSWGVFGYVVMAADWDTVQFWQKQLLALLT